MTLPSPSLLFSGAESWTHCSLAWWVLITRKRLCLVSEAALDSLVLENARMPEAWRPCQDFLSAAELPDEASSVCQDGAALYWLVDIADIDLALGLGWRSCCFPFHPAASWRIVLRTWCSLWVPVFKWEAKTELLKVGDLCYPPCKPPGMLLLMFCLIISHSYFIEASWRGLCQAQILIFDHLIHICE